MIGTLTEVMENMEKGVFNFCVDGKCIGCGKCCSDLLPLSNKEIKIIKQYVEKKHIAPTVRGIGMTMVMDLTCPFLDDSKDCDKCKIYPVRPEICKVFKCDIPPSKVQRNKEVFNRTRKICSMREMFFGKETDE